MRKWILGAVGALLCTSALAASYQYQPNDNYNLTATIATDGTTSGAVDLSGTDVVGLFIPSTFDGTTITFTASTTLTGTYVAVEDGEGAAFTVTTTASRYAPIPNLAILTGARFIKVVAGSAQTSTDTIITLATRPL